MKFLQLHNFYDRYLESFYRGRPELPTAPYQQQISALLVDGFSGGHLFSPFLGQPDYESELVIVNCPMSQLRWAREHGFSAFTPENWSIEIARAQVDSIRPDILYISHPVDGYDTRFVSRLAWKPSLVVGWRGAFIHPSTDWSGYDIILSSSTPCREAALRHGAKATEYFFPGCPSVIAERCESQAREWDVVFSGQWTGEHGRRNSLIRALAEESLKDGPDGISIGLFVPVHVPGSIPAEVARFNRGERWGMEMFRALRSGRVTLNASIDLAQGEAPNMRLFEATCAGAFLLTEHQRNLDRFFEPGTEIETFRSEAEMLEKIRYYMEDKSKRDNIANRGQARCLNDYSMEKRAAELDGIFRRYLMKKNVAGSPVGDAGSRNTEFLFEGNLGEILGSIQGKLAEMPRRIPGCLKVDGRVLQYADLHSFYFEALQIFHEGIYDVSLSADNPVILDCGAHIGLAALRFAAMYPNAEIHAFEADPAIARILRRNVASFGLRNVSVHSKAVWINGGGVKFSQSGDDSGHVLSDGGTSVESVRLRDFLSQKRVDLLKMDIEGAEYQVIEDCESVLSNVTNMVVELHSVGRVSHSLGKLLTTLERNGFDFTFGDLHAAEWINTRSKPPFRACSTSNFIITVFAWKRSGEALQVRALSEDSLPLNARLANVAGLLEEGDNEPALRALDSVSEEYPGFPLNNYARAVALARLGRIREAKVVLDSLLESKPRFAKARILRRELEGWRVSNEANGGISR